MILSVMKIRLHIMRYSFYYIKLTEYFILNKYSIYTHHIIYCIFFLHSFIHAPIHPSTHHPFIHSFIYRHLGCLYYLGNCEHGRSITLIFCFCFPLIQTQNWDCWIIMQQLNQFTFPPTQHQDFLFPYICQHLLSHVILMIANLTHVK